MNEENSTPTEEELVEKCVNRTPAGPTVENEEDLLAEMFGIPSTDGVYGLPVEEN